MNKLLIGSAAAALVVAVAPAVAQVPPPPGVAQGTAPVAPVPPARAVPPMPQTRMMAMSGKVMTRDDVLRHVRELFGRLDTNRDGFIARDEGEALHSRMMGMRDSADGMRVRAEGMRGDIEKRLAERGVFMGDRGAIFDRLDANHDGSISRQEFMAAQPQVREQRVMIMRNGVDGAPAARGAPGMRMRMDGGGMGQGMRMAGFGGHLFEMADANHDGRVSLAEAEAAALAHFDRADVNHDGRITPDEHRQVRVMRMERRPS